MTHHGLLACLVGLSLWASAACAARIDGLWQQFDDKDGQLNSLVRINTVDGKTSATVVKGYERPGIIRETLCSKCPGDFHNQPLIGLQFLWGLSQDSSGNEWQGGQILDPKEGKIYRAKATLDGDRLVVRGYLGVSLFGRSQTWIRYTGPDQ